MWEVQTDNNNNTHTHTHTHTKKKREENNNNRYYAKNRHNIFCSLENTTVPALMHACDPEVKRNSRGRVYRSGGGTLHDFI